MESKQTEYWASKNIALLNALMAWPRLPEPDVLLQLAYAADWAQDSPRGKKLQVELGLDAIPPVSECESGAGFWDRITCGAWRQYR